MPVSREAAVGLMLIGVGFLLAQDGRAQSGDDCLNICQERTGNDASAKKRMTCIDHCTDKAKEKKNDAEPKASKATKATEMLEADDEYECAFDANAKMKMKKAKAKQMRQQKLQSNIP